MDNMTNSSQWQHLPESNNQSDLARSYRTMFEKELLTDVTFKVAGPGDNGSSSSRSLSGAVGNGLVRAHRSVLIARCEFFEAMFSVNMSESQAAREDPITITDIEEKTFRQMLWWIYCDEVDVTPCEALSLLLAARKHLLSGLAKSCAEIIVDRMELNHTCAVMELSRSSDLDELTDACLSHIGRNMFSFVDTDAFFQLSRDSLEDLVGQDALELYEESDVYEACMSWAHRQQQVQQAEQGIDLWPTDEQLRETLGSVIYRIRFPTMKRHEVTDLVRGSNLLSPEEKIAVLLQFVDPADGQQSVPDRGDHQSVPFDCAPRSFLLTAVYRFGRCEESSSYSDGRRVGICFQTSVDVTLDAVGLYGTTRPSTDRVTVTVHRQRQSTGKSAWMTSDGSRKPIRVPLGKPIEIEAGKIYTVVASIAARPGTLRFSGYDARRTLPLCDGETVRFTPCYFNNQYAEITEVNKGQIPALYFRVPTSA